MLRRRAATLSLRGSQCSEMSTTWAGMRAASGVLTRYAAIDVTPGPSSEPSSPTSCSAVPGQIRPWLPEWVRAANSEVTETASDLRKRGVGPVGLEPTTGGLKGRTRTPFRAEFPCPSGPSRTATIPQGQELAACTRPISGHGVFVPKLRAGVSAHAVIVLRGVRMGIAKRHPEIRRRGHWLAARVGPGRRASGPSLARGRCRSPCPRLCPAAEPNQGQAAALRQARPPRRSRRRRLHCGRAY